MIRMIMTMIVANTSFAIKLDHIFKIETHFP